VKNTPLAAKERVYTQISSKFPLLKAFLADPTLKSPQTLDFKGRGPKK
jgi:hypothetical protein